MNELLVQLMSGDRTLLRFCMVIGLVFAAFITTIASGFFLLLSKYVNRKHPSHPDHVILLCNISIGLSVSTCVFCLIATAIWYIN